MAETIETKIISIKDAKNGNFDIALKNFPQAEPEEGVVQMRANVIQIRNARNGDFDLVIPEDHTLEDALVQNTPMDEYTNNRITTIKQNGFYGGIIDKLMFQNVTRTYADAFRNCTAQEIYLPNLTNIAVNGFNGCSNLKVVDCGEIGSFVNGLFSGCAQLDTLIFHSFCEPSTSGYLQPTKLNVNGGDGGYVYVPQALLSQYQSSQRWANYANVLEFRPIEGSEYEIVE